MAIEQRDQVDLAFLQSFLEAFNRHDLDGIMAHMTEDCVFYRSSGSTAQGTRYDGQAAVREAFADVFRLIQGAHFAPLRDLVMGDRGLSQWVLSGTLPDGNRFEAAGVDLFEFRNSKIAVKDSYTKRRG